METLLYDGSFLGWLSVVFEVYEHKLADLVIRPATNAPQSLFGQTRTIHTDETKAARVWKGLQTRISRNATKQLYRAFLSEEKAIEDQLLQYVRYAFSKKLSVEYDYAHPAIKKVIDTDKKVRREKHRMEAFVRFQQTQENLWFAAISPDFDVLPLIRRHFEERYADQSWVIYDLHRKYGIHYDGRVALPVEIDFADDLNPATNLQPVLHPNEEQYRLLWQHYFTNVNIPARKNLRLHLRHMPARYWKFLPEKQFGFS
jgi:probable DNA metabolism protein